MSTGKGYAYLHVRTEDVRIYLVRGTGQEPFRELTLTRLPPAQKRAGHKMEVIRGGWLGPDGNIYNRPRDAVRANAQGALT